MADSIRITAPDALAAYVLKVRLDYVGEVAILADDAGQFELLVTERPGAGDGLEEVLGSVRRWLVDEGIPSTVVHVDGVSQAVTGEVGGGVLAA